MIGHYAYDVPRSRAETAPEGEISVTEIREITHNGELVGKPEVPVERSGGTYASTVPLHLPPNAPGRPISSH